MTDKRPHLAIKPTTSLFLFRGLKNYYNYYNIIKIISVFLVYFIQFANNTYVYLNIRHTLKNKQLVLLYDHIYVKQKYIY